MKSSEINSEIDTIVKSKSEGVYSKWRIGRANSSSDAKEQLIALSTNDVLFLHYDEKPTG
ncbi:MAG: hypothetical protein ACE5RG_07955 [Candidatus Nitrosomaritimum yanchengensis]